jgi:hypothetical protein
MGVGASSAPNDVSKAAPVPKHNLWSYLARFSAGLVGVLALAVYLGSPWGSLRRVAPRARPSPEPKVEAPRPDDSQINSTDQARAVGQGKALIMIARYVGSNSIWLDRQLKGNGFQPDLPPDLWRKLPAVRKLERFYLAAQAGEPGGGDKALAMLAHDLAQEYGSARYDPALRRYLASPKPEGHLTLGKPASDAQLEWRANPEAGRAILAIGEYCDGGTMGGAQGILQHYLDLPPETAYEILRTSDSGVSAIQRAIYGVPEQQRAPRIRTIINTLQESYESARNEEAFVPFSDRHDWAPRVSRPTVAKTARGGVDYAAYLESNHLKETNARSFESLKADSGSFGGRPAWEGAPGRR